MSEITTDTARYRVRVAGQLDEHWAVWLEGWQIAPGEAGTTTLEGYGADQSALYGLILRLRDLGGASASRSSWA